MIRLARPDEVAALRDIERLAGELFRQVAMDDVADHEPPSVSELLEYQEDGRCFVSTEGDVAVGYLLVDLVDGAAHVEQLSVLPACGRQGRGRGLLEHVASWAKARGLSALTLTTFRDVAWNGPWYERFGFRALSDDELTGGLRRIRDLETAHGLDPDRRVCMRRDL